MQNMYIMSIETNFCYSASWALSNGCFPTQKEEEVTLENILKLNKIECYCCYSLLT